MADGDAAWNALRNPLFMSGERSEFTRIQPKRTALQTHVEFNTAHVDQHEVVMTFRTTSRGGKENVVIKLIRYAFVNRPEIRPWAVRLKPVLGPVSYFAPVLPVGTPLLDRTSQFSNSVVCES
jgi:hypothetical protein